MQSYEQAAVKLGQRDSRKVANNTYLQKRGEDIAVRLHSTDVVLYHKDGTATLNSGGWLTKTTKERINNAVRAGLYASNSLWYFRNGQIFEDGVVVGVEGLPIYKEDVFKRSQIETDLKAKKVRIKKYIDGFCAHIKAGELAFPGGGDCWHCLMFEQADMKDDGHIRLHMSEDEKYYVPSLLFNAIKAKGYSNPPVVYQMIKADGERGRLFHATRRILRDYLMKRDV